MPPVCWALAQVIVNINDPSSIHSLSSIYILPTVQLKSPNCRQRLDSLSAVIWRIVAINNVDGPEDIFELLVPLSNDTAASALMAAGAAKRTMSSAFPIKEADRSIDSGRRVVVDHKAEAFAPDTGVKKGALTGDRATLLRQSGSRHDGKNNRGGR